MLGYVDRAGEGAAVGCLADEVRRCARVDGARVVDHGQLSGQVVQ